MRGWRRTRGRGGEGRGGTGLDLKKENNEAGYKEEKGLDLRKKNAKALSSESKEGKGGLISGRGGRKGSLF